MGSSQAGSLQLAFWFAFIDLISFELHPTLEELGYYNHARNALHDSRIPKPGRRSMPDRRFV